MSIAPKTMGLGELALRAANRPGAWFVLLVNAEPGAEQAARELMDELAPASRAKPLHVHAPPGPEDLAISFAEAPPGEIVVSGLDAFTAEHWAQLDRMRSRYRRAECVILVMPAAAMDRLMQRAPNLASWIGGALWRWDEDADLLSDAERDKRLEALRAWADMSDAELIARAEEGEVFADPEYAEWLILLGRGELLERG